MTTDRDHVEPVAAAPPAERRRFLTLAGLFLAGPTIWITHFMVVYLLAEWLCHSSVDARFLGLRPIAVITAVTTAIAVVPTVALALRSYRRWRASGLGFDAQATPGDEAAGRLEPDAELALGGFLLGMVFALSILLVGIPALVLEPC